MELEHQLSLELEQSLQFDLFIPKDSVLRDTSVMPSAVTVSGIQSGYYFTVFDSNVGSGLTSYENAIGTSPVGIGHILYR